MTLGLIVGLLAGGVSDEAGQALVQRFEAVGRAQPTADSTLAQAAQALAKICVARGPAAAVAPLAVASAISASGGWDAQPVVLAYRGSAPEVLKRLAEDPLLTDRAVSHVGLGAADGGGVQALVVVLARRRVLLEPFPRSIPLGTTRATLCATPAAPFEAVDVFVTSPSGAVQKLPLPRGKRRCVALTFTQRGRHAIELLGKGPQGPEVLALFFAARGHDDLDEPEAIEEDDGAPRQTIVARIAALRASQGAPAVAADPVLDAVAQAYADRMAAGRFHAHTSPDGDALPERLAAAGYEAASAAECLASDRSPSAAHFGIEHSPAHRGALIDPRFRRFGLGLATATDGTVALVEVFAEPLDAEPTPVLFAALQALRRRLGLPRLSENPVAAAVALDHLRRAIEHATPKLVVPGAPDVQDRALIALPDAAAVGVDVLVLSSPSAADRTAHLVNPDFRQVGLAARHVRVPGGGVRTWAVAVYVAP